MITGDNYEKCKQLFEENKEWYFGNLTREEVIKIMLAENDGSYLIRDCILHPGSYVLMVKERPRLNKYIISPCDNSVKIGNSQFESIECLLDHFSKNIIQSTTLSKPAAKQVYEVINDYKPNTDIELNVKAGDLVNFVLKGDKNLVLCQHEKTEEMGWLLLDYLKPFTKTKTTANAMIIKLRRHLPYKTSTTKSRNPSVFDKTQLTLKVSDDLTITEVSDDGMLKASTKDGREGFVPINLIRISDLKNGI